MSTTADSYRSHMSLVGGLSHPSPRSFESAPTSTAAAATSSSASASRAGRVSCTVEWWRCRPLHLPATVPAGGAVTVGADGTFLPLTSENLLLTSENLQTVFGPGSQLAG
jgi:hypothetical protein